MYYRFSQPEVVLQKTAIVLCTLLVILCWISEDPSLVFMKVFAGVFALVGALTATILIWDRVPRNDKFLLILLENGFVPTLFTSEERAMRMGYNRNQIAAYDRSGRCWVRNGGIQEACAINRLLNHARFPVQFNPHDREYAPIPRE